MIVAGIDVGSLTSKAVILKDKKLHSSALRLTGTDVTAAAETVFREALDKGSLKPECVERIISTGYGRINIPFADKSVTEITCNAIGVHFLYPNARLVIDIGGQDCKAIKMDDQGKVITFAMNDKCAAGTGKFLEIAAQTLDMNLRELGSIGLEAKNKVLISSTCTVFAQTEIVSLIAQRVQKGDIAVALHTSIASRIYGLICSTNPDFDEQVVLTGGVAYNNAIVKTLEKKLECEITVPENPQIVTALGAAVKAISNLSK